MVEETTILLSSAMEPHKAFQMDEIVLSFFRARREDIPWEMSAQTDEFTNTEI